MKKLAALLVAITLAGSTSNQDLQGVYLPPSPSPCTPTQETRYETQIITQNVNQPVTIDTTRTVFAQAVATATMGITTHMAQTETRQVNVPITSIFEVTSTSVVDVVMTRIVQVPPVVSTVVTTQIIPTMQFNQVTQTEFETRVQPVQRVDTQFSTVFETQTTVQNIQGTTIVNLPPVISTILQTQQDFRTETDRLPDFTSVVTSVQVQTSQAVQFFTPPPIVVTNTQFQTRFSTQVQQVLRTEQAFTTAVNTREQVIPQTSVQLITQTSVVVSQRIQTAFSVIDKIITQTQVVPQVITQTSFVSQLNPQIITQTQTQFVTDTQTVQGQDQYVTQVVTMRQDQGQVVTQTIGNGQQSTVEKVVTAPCSQQAGYNYNTPAVPVAI